MATVEPIAALGLYVHLPWCTRKCPYCDFNSHAASDLPELSYISALLADLDHDQARITGRPLESIFIGGGTPSLFSVSAIASLLGGIRERVDLAPDCEITLEANPGSAEADRFAGYLAAGVNRLSIGVQSFDDAALKSIGRIHDARTAHLAVETAQAAGMERINIDLMYGLPGQSRRAALADVEQALEHGVSHLSHYELTIEPNTLFQRFPPPRPDEDALWAMHESSLALIESAGLRRYEISAYSRPGAECRHNLNYWRFGDYLGIGAGAHGKLTRGASGVIERSVKHRHPRRYLAALGGGDHEARRGPVAAAELPLEFMLNAARLLGGFSEELFEARTGLPISVISAPLAQAEERGLIRRKRGSILPTERGTQFLNDFLILFEPQSPAPPEAAKRAPVDRDGGPPVL
ncbi:MAG: radical SAM family heme chaperone HemW [Gammaproteobacteria bacterium]|jgi:oxygen-independent coproporphyrinogen-3 oxidase|nr:radical SAM family heme chaperone HemW [Gammaproteobacteria bacterium]